MWIQKYHDVLWKSFSNGSIEDMKVVQRNKCEKAENYLLDTWLDTSFYWELSGSIPLNLSSFSNPNFLDLIFSL